MDNPMAFPQPRFDAFGHADDPQDQGMTLRDWFASTAPEPTLDAINTQQGFDRGRNPYNDAHKPPLRSREQIVAELRYRYADAMLAARTNGGQSNG